MKTKSRFYKRPSMKQQFVWFLMREGALVKFVNNRKRRAEAESTEYLFSKGNYAFYIHWICDAFDWSRAPEGYRYWSRLSGKWVYEARKIFTS